LATIASPLAAFPPARPGVVLAAAPTCPLPYSFLRGPSSARRGNAFIGTPDQCIAKIKRLQVMQGSTVLQSAVCMQSLTGAHKRGMITVSEIGAAMPPIKREEDQCL
jgi:alkanesulfonate monooxygenase SsuD/methylene tetrahydromethanopterin reductase-like flavin-dependent oxidoreductase (luciferase family)